MSGTSRIDRRTLLVWAAGTSLGATGLFVVATALRALVPPRRSLDGWSAPGPQSVCRLSDLAAGRPLLVEYGEHRLYVLRTGRSRVAAYDSACPHARCTLTWNERSARFDCPCHGSSFDIAGRRLAGPARRDLARARVRVVADDVIVDGIEP